MIASASIQRRTKNVGIISVVILELKIRDVQRQVFAADSPNDSDASLWMLLATRWQKGLASDGRHGGVGNYRLPSSRSRRCSGARTPMQLGKKMETYAPPCSTLNRPILVDCRSKIGRKAAVLDKSS